MREYCKNTVKWEKQVNTGYGATYLDYIDVKNVYIEQNIQLKKGINETTSSNALVICYENITFKQNDRITFPDNSKYLITTIEIFNKPRSITFDHIELILTNVSQ